MAKSKIVFSWSANSETNIPIVAAFLGLLVSMAILTCGSRDGKGYHDFALLNKSQLAESALKARIQKLQPLYSALLPYNRYSTAKDSVAKRDSFLRVQAALVKAHTELYNLSNTNIDTNLSYYSQHISVNRDTLAATLNAFNASGTHKTDTAIAITSRDSSTILSDTPILRKTVLQIGLTKPMGLVDFADKYPVYGFWYFLSIAQMTMWFLIATLLVGSTVSINKVISKYYHSNNRIEAVHLVIPAIVIALFVIFLYELVLDRHIIPDIFFMGGFTNRMQWYSTVGYLVTIGCFGAYLSLINKLELSKLTIDARSNDKTPITDFEQIKSSLDFAFICSAVILSFFVLWLGVLFSAINAMEAMRFYQLFSGKPFLSYDFVYLIGLLHTLLLLIFYLPVRIQLNKLTIKQQSDINKNQELGSKKYFKAFWESISAILVTTSPLLTTVLQQFLSNLFS